MSKYTEYVNARIAGFNHFDSCKVAEFQHEITLPVFPSVDEVRTELEKIAPDTTFANTKWSKFFEMVRHRLPYPPLVCGVILSCIERMGYTSGHSCWAVPGFNCGKYEKIVALIVE